MYFVSKVLTDVETRYLDFKLVALTLRVAAKKLHLYFQAHIINVLSNYSLRAILHKPDTIGRLLKWAIELREFDIVYRPRLTIKGQVLIDLIVEFSYWG